MQHPHQRRLIVLVLLFAALVTGGGYMADQQLRLNGRRAEARLLLSYMATLQSAYYADKNKYVRFDDWYGAPEQGKSRCQRPLGAAELGFVIESCAKADEQVKVRYAYRAPIKESTVFAGEGASGSDELGQSLVCLGETTQDGWRVDQSKIPEHVRDCR